MAKRAAGSIRPKLALVFLLSLPACGGHYFAIYRDGTSDNQQALQELELGMSADQVGSSRVVRQVAVATALLALLPGCKTVPKSQIHNIDVPPGLTAQQVEFAILVSLADQAPPQGLTPGNRHLDPQVSRTVGPEP